MNEYVREIDGVILIVIFYLTPRDDLFTAPLGQGAEVHGRRGNDMLYGGSFPDIIHGDRGNDSLYGYGANDRLEGAWGADHLYGGSGNDTLLGGMGNDYLEGNGGVNRLLGGDGDDQLYGSQFSDTDPYASATMYGGRGNDTIQNWHGSSTSFGGKGADFFAMRGTWDTVFGEDGNDQILVINGDAQGGRGSDFLYAVALHPKPALLYANGGVGGDLFAIDAFNDAVTSVLVIVDFQSGEDHIRFYSVDPDWTVRTQLENLDTNRDGLLSSLDGFDGRTGVFDGGGPTGVAVNIMMNGDYVQVWGQQSLGLSDFILGPV